MNIKKNFLYSGVLVASNYILPLLTFPYVSRVLGPANIGIYNFVDSIVNYFILFSMLGIGSTGIRVVAKNKLNSTELNQSFSSLVFLNTISTVVILGLFLLFISIVPKFNDYKEMFYIGSAKILFNLLLIEWFYTGMENFKYITIRIIAVKLIYTVAIFLFIKAKDDYILYYSITVISVVINALFNWTYSKRFVKISIKNISLKPYLKSYFILGFYVLLTSMYTTFNVAYLGFMAGNEEVGYYTTATKLYGILLALFSAFTGVMLPRISSLVSTGNIDEIKRLIQKSFDILFMFSFPLIIFSIILAPQIIYIIAGVGYEGAIMPMRIVMPLMLIIGLEQILILQLLMPFNKDQSVLINSVIGAAVGLALNLLLVSYFKSVGSSIVWVISETAVLLSACYFAKSKIGISIDIKKLLQSAVYSLPYVAIIYMVSIIHATAYYILFTASLGCLLYFVFLHIILLKNELIFDALPIFRKLLLKYNLIP
ncbi:oligosaccharide flippase family protein [Spirosoma jeollabukense]